MAGVRHFGEHAASEAEYETQFSILVEQEVEKRLFQVSFWQNWKFSSKRNGKVKHKRFHEFFACVEIQEMQILQNRKKIDDS